GPLIAQQVEGERLDQDKAPQALWVLQCDAERDGATIGVTDKMDGVVAGRQDRFRQRRLVGEFQRTVAGPRVGFAITVEVRCQDAAMSLQRPGQTPPLSARACR